VVFFINSSYVVPILGAKFNNKQKTFNFANTLKQQKTMKKWRREWKIKLIEEQNPEWLDLSGVLFV